MSPPSPWWVPVAGAADLRAATPLAARAFGEDLVLWRAGEGAAPSAFVDRCPHRGARLSRGRVADGRLECAYHGWRFEAGGQCVGIPALPGFTPPAAHRACSWQAMEAHGLVWACADASARDGGGDGTGEALLAPDPLEGLPARRVLCGPFDVATSAPRVVENFLDTAHFGFVHEGFLGSREQPDHLSVPDYRVEADSQGRPGVPLYRAWQPRASTAAQGGAWVDYSYRLLGPWSALLTKKAEGSAPSEAYALWCCPLEEEHTRVWFTICTDDTSQGDDALRAFQATIFSQDAPVLESQRPRRLPLAAPGTAGAELHCAADRLSVAYRRWLGELGARFGTC
ncbi:MAG: aromatic ring-hydroxylating dioxygenase subunit alpha [Rubrivivax sp.]|nr:aromatic ring-hydroxylating dioxygenase subunit alpha [Rubrivivax sp.]